ncbi:MAG: hypothetical protein ACXWEY_16940 [Bacteroidia bacterium]
MKSVFILFLSIFFTTHIWAIDINQVRVNFTKAVEDEKIALKMLAELESVKNSNPLYLAYYGAFQSLLAKHAFNPYNKLDYLKKSQATLKKAIAKKPDDAEMRFLRFSIQYYVPKFLGFSNDLDEDKKVILANVHRCPAEVSGVISRFMLETDMLSETEKKQLQQNAS